MRKLTLARGRTMEHCYDRGRYRCQRTLVSMAEHRYDIGEGGGVPGNTGFTTSPKKMAGNNGLVLVDEENEVECAMRYIACNGWLRALFKRKKKDQPANWVKW